MLWSELPKEYQDLEKGFSDLCYFYPDSENLLFRFHWFLTYPGEIFWCKCHDAETIEQLPPIPQTN